MGERLELHRRMAGVVETSWSLGDIDRAFNKNVWNRAWAGLGKFKDLGIPVRGDSE